jgi:acyl-coenzyme A thioesterase PaaI-like protein
LNAHGLNIKSYWEDGESVCRFQPQPFHTGGYNFVYGGLIASLMDCHGAATASAEKHRREGREYGEGVFTRFVTASLNVDYLSPVPIDGTIVVRATVSEIKGRKSVVEITLDADGKVRAKGKMVAIQMPDGFLDS